MQPLYIQFVSIELKISKEKEDEHKTKLRISSVGKDVEQLEFSFTASKL